MADLPQGPDDEGADQSRPNPFSGTPFEQIFSSMASGDMSGLQGMFGQLQQMFTPHEGAVNWQLAGPVGRRR